MLSCVERCVGYLRLCFTRDGCASKEETGQRVLIFIVACVAAVGCLATIMTLDIAKEKLLFLSMVLTILCNVPCLIYVLLKARLTEALIQASVIGSYIALCFGDLTGRGVNTLAWPVFVLVLDFSLVLGLKDRFSAGLVGCSVGWLLLMTVESVMRFGLYDAPLTTSQETRREVWGRAVDCTALPCPEEVSVAFQRFLVSTVVFSIDYIATRGFAASVRKEQATMQRTIDTVQEIAVLLAAYDLDRVNEILSKSALPAEMHSALEALESHLRQYQPYIPSALFDIIDESPRKHSQLIAAPGLKSNHATIAFTDIRGSTAIWEATGAMREALRVHNAVMRTALDESGGYEVKTIGDAFMIAFDTLDHGIRFGLTIQERLLEAIWPPALLDIPICSIRGTLWGGLTVRVGVNSGEVSHERNALTDRYDYFGNTVNVASRLESLCIPGAVAIPTPLWESVAINIHAYSESRPLSLKGVAGVVDVSSVWPQILRGRKQFPLERRVSSKTVSDAESISTPKSSQNVGKQCITSVATIGVLEMASSSLREFGLYLEGVAVALDAGGGTWLSLTGNRICVGFNISRTTKAHVESALRFVQKIMRGDQLTAAGTASGTIQHGTVGTRTHRFLAAIGTPLQRSEALCSQTPHLCRYSPQEGIQLPVSLQYALESLGEGVYKVLPIEDSAVDLVSTL